jgi:hypothetical protein
MVGGCRWHENLLGGVDLDDGVGERLWGLLGKVVAEPPWMVRRDVTVVLTLDWAGGAVVTRIG